MSFARSALKVSSQIGRRQFSATAIMPATQEWMIILPDHAGVLEKRMKVRPDHLSKLKPNIESGFFVFGGARLDEPIKEGEGPKINGSVMLAVADTKEEVMEKIKSDIYFTSGVWDESKIQIFPFKSAIREQLK